MSERACCWSCGAVLELDPREPVGRGERCSRCDADVRACRACVAFDPNISDGCREPSAERVFERDQANFCGWYQLRLGPRDAAAALDPAAEAKRRLEALFRGRS